MKTEIAFKDEIIFEGNEYLPFKKGDKFYFSAKRPYPKNITDYKDLMKGWKQEFIDSYLKQVDDFCNEYHIKQFKVKRISFSVTKDFSKFILDSSKGLETSQCIEVVEAIYWKFWKTYKWKNFWKNIFNFKK